MNSRSLDAALARLVVVVLVTIAVVALIAVGIKSVSDTNARQSSAIDKISNIHP